jgi:hypothetical protein
LHDGLFDFFGPDFGGPITDRQEELQMGGISLHRVDGTVMATTLGTVSG